MIGVVVNFKGYGGENFYLNDQSSMLAGYQSGFGYYVWITAVDGLDGTDISAESHPLPHAIGDTSGDIYRKGKGITLSGSIEAPNVDKLEAAAEYLMNGFWDTRPRKLTWTPRGSTTERYITCYVLNDLSISRAMPQSYTRPTWTWTVGLRADNPRFYKSSDNTLLYPWQT
jgi:hypothetical protein